MFQVVRIIGLSVRVVRSPHFLLAKQSLGAVFWNFLLMVFLQDRLSMEFLGTLVEVRVVEGVHLGLWFHLLVI